MNLIKDHNVHETKIKNMGKMFIPDPDFGDLKLNLMPFVRNGNYVYLPPGFELWNNVANEMIRHIPIQDGNNQHYITIDSRFFPVEDTLRREGVHADGNFCVDPSFIYQDSKEFKATWGGNKPTWGGNTPSYPTQPKSKPKRKSKSKPTWGGNKPKSLVEQPDNSHVSMAFASPYNVVIPIAKYISGSKGGLLCASSLEGCRAWAGIFHGEVMEEGCWRKMEDQLPNNKKINFKSHRMYFMTSNTPHESLPIKMGSRRTLIRITLNHNYDNSVFFNN